MDATTALPRMDALTPTAEKNSTGPISTTLRYWLTRWARGRVSSTRQV